MMRCVCNRRVLGWALFALVLAGIAWTLDAWLPPEPRWSRHGRFANECLTPTASRVVFHQPPGTLPEDVSGVAVVDGRTGETLGTYLKTSAMHTLTCSTDGRFVADLTLDWAVGIADTERGEERVVKDAPGPFGQLHFSPDGEHLLMTKGRGDSCVVHVPSGKVLAWFVGAKLAGRYVIHQTGKLPAEASLEVYDPRRGATVAKVSGAELLGMSRDGTTLYARQREHLAGPFNRVILWDMATARVRAEIAIPANEVLQWFTCAPDDRTAAIVTLARADRERHYHVAFWDMASAQQVARVSLPWAPDYRSIWSPDGQRFAAATSDGELIVLDTRTARKLWQLATKLDWTDGPRYPFFTSDSQLLVLQSRQELQWRDAATGELLEKRFETGQFIAPPSPAWQRDRLLVYDTPGWAQLRQPGWLQQLVRKSLPATWLPPEENWLGVYVFDARTRHILFEQAEPQLTTALLSDDGDTVLTIHTAESGEQLLRCWDVPARKPLRWVLGVPLGLAALVLTARCAWRRRRGRRAVATAPQGGAPCP